jgi:hypothetical protein
MTITPILVITAFTTVITGLFNLSEFLPLPVALLAGAALGVVISLAGQWIRSRPWGARCTDVFVGLGAVGFAFAGCGGLMAILLLNGALDSGSLTGETLESTFLPSIPYYIAVNGVLEMLIIPAVVALCWQPGRRRVLIIATAAAYFAMRVWTYLAFVPARLGWAESSHAANTLTSAERRQAADDLFLADPRWAMLLVMFVAFLVALRSVDTRDCG